MNIIYLLMVPIFIFFIILGYILANIIHQPKKLKKIIDNLENDNKILSKQNQELEKLWYQSNELSKKLDETIKSNTNWYITNINTLGQYLKDKHNDNYVFDQLKNIPGIGDVEKKEYNLDILLDKLSVGGWSSLTKDEIDYLRNQGSIN